MAFSARSAGNTVRGMQHLNVRRIVHSRKCAVETSGMPNDIIGTVVRAAVDSPDGRVAIRSADDQLHKISAHHARGSFQVEDRVEHHITTAGGIPRRAEWRPALLPTEAGRARGEHAPKPQVVSMPVRVREIPGATSDDSFVLTRAEAMERIEEIRGTFGPKG